MAISNFERAEPPIEMTYLYIQQGTGGFSWDGKNWEHSWTRLFNYQTPGMKDICSILSRFADHHHHQIALDAGGEVVSEQPSGYGGSRQTVAVNVLLLQKYAALLEQQHNPNAGMMQTSRGEWVMADDWDAIEGAR